MQTALSSGRHRQDECEQHVQPSHDHHHPGCSGGLFGKFGVLGLVSSANNLLFEIIAIYSFAHANYSADS